MTNFSVYQIEILEVWHMLLISLGMAALVCIVFFFFIVPRQRKHIELIRKGKNINVFFQENFDLILKIIWFFRGCWQKRGMSGKNWEKAWLGCWNPQKSSWRKGSEKRGRKFDRQQRFTTRIPRRSTEDYWGQGMRRFLKDSYLPIPKLSWFEILKDRT